MVRNELISKISTVLGKKTKYSDLDISLLIMRDNVLFYEEIYTAGKKITLLQVVPVVTNLTSVNKKDAKIINSVFFKFSHLSPASIKPASPHFLTQPPTLISPALNLNKSPMRRCGQKGS